MRRLASLLLLLSFGAALGSAQDRTKDFDPAKMRERVKRLSADDFEGRGPGTDGGKRAAQYIADQMRSIGVKPANNGSYFQNVKLIGVKASPATVLGFRSEDKNGLDLKFGDDFVASTGTQTGDVSIDADLVFVGYGIDAPLYRWNDYKGDPNRYKGKVLMILVNDPAATAAEPDLFGGETLTYYGRWTYKYEEAARHGAAGVILIHTNESAGYGWNVIRTSNGSWRYEIARNAGDTDPFLQFKSWVTGEAASKIFKTAHLGFEELKGQAEKRDFKPVDTGLRVKLDLRSEVKAIVSPNVVGIVDGKDAKKRSEYVVFSAHWDHLGIGEANEKGDRIYNGAYDNASGVAALLGVAEVLAKTPVEDRPDRSFLFLFPTAEEQGLLGAEYYSHHPLIPLSKTAADVNVDGVNFFGKVTNFYALGADRSAIIDQIKAAAGERDFRIDGDMNPEQGFFFRSDHFPFAKAGVPSVNFQHGDLFEPALKGESAEFYKDYTAKYYHQVTDEYHDWWNMDAMVQEAEMILAIGTKIANTPDLPRFKDADEFSPADKARFKR